MELGTGFAFEANQRHLEICHLFTPPVESTLVTRIVPFGKYNLLKLT